MSPDLTMITEGKKFLWDGQLYESKEEAARVAESYRNEKFEVELAEEDGKFLVYSRRAVKEWVATTQ